MNTLKAYALSLLAACFLLPSQPHVQSVGAQSVDQQVARKVEPLPAREVKSSPSRQAPLPSPLPTDFAVSPEQKITFELSTGANASRRYRVGESIPLICRITNADKRRIGVLIETTKSYHYPAGIQARVQDESGTVLTLNNITNGEWWTNYWLSSQSGQFKRRKQALVRLHPNEGTSFVVHLDEVIYGCDSLENHALRKGTYQVQLRLNGSPSNVLQIEVY